VWIFFETSAKSDTSPNISKMFYFLTEKLLDRKHEASLLEHNLATVHQQSTNINLTNTQNNTTYGRLLSCCSSTGTVDD